MTSRPWPGTRSRMPPPSPTSQVPRPAARPSAAFLGSWNIRSPGPPAWPTRRYRLARFWIRACTDPFGSRNELLPYLRRIPAPPLKSRLCGESVRPRAPGRIRARGPLAARRHAAAAGPPARRAPAAAGLTALGRAYIDTGRWDEALERCRRGRRPGRGEPHGNHCRDRRLDHRHRPGHARRLRRGSPARRPGARHRRSGRMRAGGRPGPAGPRRRRPRRRQPPPSVHPAPRAVQRGRHAPCTTTTPTYGCRSRRRRGPRRPADGSTRHP